MEADRKIGWTFKRPYPASEPVLWRQLLGTSMESSCCNKCVPGIIRVATPSPNRPRPISYFREGPQAQSSSEFATTLMGLREGKPKTVLWDPIHCYKACKVAIRPRENFYEDEISTCVMPSAMGFTKNTTREMSKIFLYKLERNCQ